MRKPCLIFIVSFVLFGQQKYRQYRDPYSAFSIDVPEGYTITRNESPAGWLTTIAAKSPILNLTILANPTASPAQDPADLRAFRLRELARPHLEGWYSALRSQTAGAEIARKPYPCEFQGAQAIRMDVRYFRREGHEPRVGYAVFFIGKKDALLIAVTAERIGIDAADRLLGTLRFER